jgi:hypothetical protein
MALSPGTRFGPYEIVAAIGVGGMGEVYRASDANLKRDVAIKVLPPFFAADADRVARFQREAEVLAAFSHQNIAHVYGLERGEGMMALVMELVDGPTLADRLARGAIPLDEALPIAMQIADALDAAHERGIVHRDLKPANVKLRPDGAVKVLDFGIAKVLQPTQAASGPQTVVANTPSFTQIGVILGTAAYMSPEQARGKPVDKRTDIWAFGCVLYEMLAGRPAFDGEDATVTVGRVLEREVDMSALPAAVPPSVRQVLAVCLRKDPRKRLRDIGDAKLALDGTFETRSVDAAVAARTGRRFAPIAAALLVGLAAAGLAAWRLTPAPEVAVVTRFSEPIAIGTGAPFLSISHDGGRVAWSGPSGIHIRRLDDFAAQPVPGFADTGVNRPPCFSPDGASIAYRTADRIRRMPVGGGTALTLADGVTGGQCHWGDDGYVYFLSAEGISRVAETGGTPEVVVARDGGGGESVLFAPQLLPGGRHLLFSVLTTGGENDPHVIALDLRTQERKSVLEQAAYAGYVALGDDAALLVYSRDDTLFSAPLDLARVEAGDGRPVLGFPSVTTAVVSPSGTLAYLPAGGDGLAGDASLVWVGRDGAEQALPEPPHRYGEVTLAPGGERAVVSIVNPRVLSNVDLWLYDLAVDGLRPVTFGGSNVGAIWTPDGRQLIYSHTSINAAATGNEIRVIPADTSGPAVTIVESSAAWKGGDVMPESVSPDGSVLMVTTNYLGTGDIWAVPLGAAATAGATDAAPRPFIATAYDERIAVFSPNSRFVAYQSDESGTAEIYVVPYPGPGPKSQVSRGGGELPRWSADGRELFYLNGAEMMVADVDTSDAFRALAPRALFAFPARTRERGYTYSVAADGTRFLLVKSHDVGGEPPVDLRIVVNWAAELARVGPAR